MTNIILTVIAALVVAGGVFFAIKAAQGIRNWNGSTLRKHQLFGVILLVVAIAMVVGGLWWLIAHASGGIPAGTSETAVTASPTPTPTIEPTATPDATVASKATAAPASATDGSPGGSWVNVVLSILGLALLGLAVFAGIKTGRSARSRGKVSNVLRFVGTALILGASIWLLVANVPHVFAMITGERTEVADEQKQEDDGNTDAAATEEPNLDNGELPEGAFAVNLSEDDLLKAMKNRLGDDFSWEEYQSNFSDDLFPSRYQERKASSKAAMQKWYKDKKKEGFSDPVWFAMDDLISIYHSDKWKKMSRDDKLSWIDKNVRFPAYDQILRNPRFCEMYVEFFYELSKEFPEIVSRNQSWLPDFKAWFDKANDVSNKVKDADGNEIVAGISVFFEPVQNSGDAKVLQKEYVMNAARICLMFDEFTPALKTVQSPRSKVNWHLAFGKDAQTAKVSKLAKEKDQEKEPAVIWLYRYKGRTAMKTGSNIFDHRLEIFPLTKKVKEEKPIKEPTPKTTPGPRNNPDPGNNPGPGKKATPKPTKGPKETPKPGKNKPTPEPGKNKPTPEPGKPTPTPTTKPKKPGRRPTGNNVPDGPTNNNTTAQPTKPSKDDYKPVPAQPTKKPDSKPTQKPNAPAGNGSSSSSGKTDSVPVYKDTNATVTNPDGSTTTTNTSDGKPNGKVPSPSD